MGYMIARGLGPRVRRWVSIVFVVLVVWWFWGRWSLWSQVAVEHAEKFIVDHGGEAWLLRYKAQMAIEDTAAEIDRMSWVEAEAETNAAAVRAQLDIDKARASALRTELEHLRVGLKDMKFFDKDLNRALTIGEVRAREQACASEYESVNQQVAIYREAYALYVASAERAGNLQRSAAQSAARLEAQLVRLDARALWSSTGGVEDALLGEIEAELEYQAQLAAERSQVMTGLDKAGSLPLIQTGLDLDID